MLKVDDLPFPVLLGRDAPDFEVLLKDAINLATAALSEDEEAGSSNRDYNDDGLTEATGWSVNAEFQKAQSTDPTLEAA